MIEPTAIPRRLRSARRAAEVVAVLVKHGFRQVVAESGFHTLVERGQELIGHPPAAHAATLPVEERARLVLEELGPTFIKLGQVLATRPDLVPPEFVQEFKRLQADCPRVDYAEIETRLREEFGDRLETIFASIDETPLAAASIAQVHRARLADGTDVAIKVLRPGIEHTVAADMDVLTELARLAEKHFTALGYSPAAIVREFSEQMRRELDLEHERRAVERFRRQFEDDPRIVFPRVFADASTARILTMEFVAGPLLARVDPATLPEERRRRIVAVGAEAVFRQCLEYGDFHADPHPGNIVLLDGDRLCFLDCGMTGRIDGRTGEQLARLVMAVVEADLDEVLDVTIALAEADPGLRRDRAFRQDAWRFVARFEGATLAGLDMPSMLEEFFTLLRTWHVRCPADLVFLIKALTTIQGVGQQFDPSFDLVSFARPHLERLVRRRFGLAALRKRVRRGAVKYLELAEELPDEFREILDQLRKREFSVRLRHEGVERLNDDSIERASRTIAYGLVVCGLLVGSSILVLAAKDDPSLATLRTMGILGLAAAGGLMLVLVITAVRRGR